jgi:hypothetical protein
LLAIVKITIQALPSQEEASEMARQFIPDAISSRVSIADSDFFLEFNVFGNSARGLLTFSYRVLVTAPEHWGERGKRSG